MRIIKEQCVNRICLLALLLLLFTSYVPSYGQCPPVFTYTWLDATDAYTSDGEITVTVNAPTIGPFEFALLDVNNTYLPGYPISSSSTTYTFSNLSSGTYGVSVGDMGCSSFQYQLIDSIYIYSMTPGSITYSGFMGYCGTSGADITAFSNGCSSPSNLGNQFILTDISGVLIDSSVLMSDSISYSGLLANQYILEITNLDNNCISIDTFTITANSLQSSYTSVNPSSATTADGSITLNVTGSTPPLYISTDNGSSYNPWINGTPITGLLQGTYTIYVLDVNSCSSTDVVDLIYNGCSAALNTIGSCDSISLTASITNVLQGSYSYTYNLSFNGNIIETVNSISDSIVFSTIVSDSGQYSIDIINDTTGCSDSDALVINPNTMTLSVGNIILPSSDTSCNGFLFLDIIQSVSAGPYTKIWTYGAGLDTFYTDNTPGPTTSQSGLCDSTYCITVTDNNGCSVTECFDVTFTPCNTSLSIIDDIDCYGDFGQIMATVDTSGYGFGSGPQLYTYSLYSLNPQTLLSTSLPTPNLSYPFPIPLSSGSYLVEVYDASNATFCSSDSIILYEPDPINIYTTVDSTSAPWIEDGVITIDSITGGTLPYNITWLDSVGIPLPTSGILIQDSLGYSNQYNGGYTIVVTDTNGCTGQETVYIHPNNAGANLAVDSVGVEDASCFGVCDGKLYMLPYDVGPSSVAPFVYTWRNALTGVIMRVDSNGSSQYNGAPSHVATYTNRCAGFYTLEIQDAYGNTLPPIDFTVGQPDSMYVDIGPDIVIDCGEDTVLTAVTVGGNKTRDTTLVNSFILDFNNPNGIGDTLMTGGIYFLEVTGTLSDAAGNNYDAAYDYTSAPPTEVMLWNFDGANTHRPAPNMYDPGHTYSFPFIATNNGGIPGMGIHTWNVPSSNYTGQLSCNLYVIDTGIYNYSYTWTSNPLSFPIIISDEDTCYMNPGLTPTDYIVNVVDDQGCTASDTVNVMWDLYILNFQSSNTNVVPCYGDAAGTINVAVDSSSGFTPYTYSVIDIFGSPINSNIPSLDTTFGLIAGDYIVSIQDSMGCLSNNDTITITEPDSIWACGVGNLNSQFLIDNFVMNFDTISTSFSHLTPIPTLIGVDYLVVVNGTYGLDFFNSNHKDAAFVISSGIGTDDWTLNGFPIRPDIDVYNSTHEYSYTISGDGNPLSFGFVDPTGIYGDNAGSLTFSVYKLGCANTDTVYTCTSDSTGYSSISATGGQPFDPDGTPNSGDEYYNFSWIDVTGVDWTNYSITNGVTSTISGIPAGDYTVNIIDANGCNNYERYLKVLEAPTPLLIDSAEVLDVLCFGEVTAEVRAYFSGGYGPYLTVLTHVNGGQIDTVYQSINDLDSVTVDSLIYGSYTLYVYDSLPNDINGNYFCPQTFSFNITQPQTPMSSTINLLTHVSCWGDSSGAATVIATGGQSQLPYTYLWDNGENTAIADSLWADVNTAWPSAQWQGVTITDANGCTLRDSIQIEHLNEEIQAYNTLDGTNTVQVIQNVQCFNACDAIATVSSVGGVLPHIYSWDIGQTGNFMPDTAFGLCYGGHDIIIEDQVGCRKTVEYQISQPDELFANASWVDHIDCYGYNNGIAHGTATGGTLGYTFVWDSLTGQMNDTAYNLTPGIHTVFVTDANGCTASDTVTITEPSELSIVIQDTSTVYSYCTGTNSAKLCAIAFGGIEPYNYVWSDVLGQTTACADDLIAGIYTVTVLDDRGCSASDTRNIDSVTNTMSATTSVTDVSCFGLFDGSTYVDNVWGGVPITNTGSLSVDYNYSWTYPNGTIVTQQNINFLYAGNYAVTITDSNNCSITIYSNITEPEQLEYTLYNVTEATCYGACNGSIGVSVEGGTSPYSYDFDENGVFPFANPVPLINDSLILDLCAGDYDIYVTDDNDCIGTVLWGGVWQTTIDSGVVVDISGVNVTQPASCYNSSDGHANVMSPNPLFTYTWETLAGVIVDTGTHTTVLTGGDYNVVAHYADSASFGQVYTGCDYTFTFNMPSPSQILANEVIVPIACYGDANGSITLNTTGGSGSYVYQWDTTTSTPTGPTSSAISNLQEDTYTVTITDGSGCTETIDFEMIEPDALTNNFTDIVHASCNGDNDGSAKSNPSGGTPPYGYSWSPSGGGGQTGMNLSANTYTVTVTDSRSCVESFNITINEPDQIISGVEPNAFYGNNAAGDTAYHISCNGLSDGQAIVNLGGGTLPYTFLWTTGGSNQLETGMPAGTHDVTVTDANGCTETMPVTLLEPDLLVVNGYSSGYQNSFPGGFDISCKGLNDGECYADSATGGVPGTAGYIYSWSGPINGQISNLDNITNLYVGTYSVTVTDANGCSATESFILTEPAQIFNATVHLVNYAGAGVAPVNADFQDATVSMDQYDYTFYWPEGDSTDVINVTNLTDLPNHNFINIGENYVDIKIQNMHSGCIDDTTFLIEVQGIPDIHNVFTPNGDGVNDYFDFGEYGMESINVYLYNRWGELVFNWNTVDAHWDGTGLDGEDLPEGVYYYVLKAVGQDGFAYDKRGAITLLR